MRKVACLGDVSSHGGVLVSSSQDDLATLKGIPITVDTCLHSCPQFYDPPFNTSPHGVTPVIGPVVKTSINGLQIVTEGAVAGCGAIIIAPDRQMYVE